MESYLNKGIKEIISEFPEIESILDKYGIGCGPCMVGTCLLKDIVEIHDLSEEKERELMAGVNRIISPGTKVAIEKKKRKPQTRVKEATYSPPMKVLVDEHVWIKRFIDLVPKIVDRLKRDSNGDQQLVRECIEFIQQYADRFHHAKEEDILFKYFDESKDILKAMHEDHKTARAHVAGMLRALERNDTKALYQHLQAYGCLLIEHIRREDDILYPWMDRALSTTQIGKLFEQFRTVEESAPYSPREFEEFIQTLEVKFRQ